MHIVDLVNKSWPKVAERYFIGIVDKENISLDNKSIFLAGLEVEISWKLDSMHGHGGHLENALFYWWDTIWEGT